jgi:MazG family protein
VGHPNFEKLVAVIEKLRDPDKGCPWDKEQTHKSLLPYLIEESYEFLHATEENNTQKMEDELGDVLLQVLLHGQIGKENNHFDIESISNVLAEKLIRRHPHVFEENFDKIDSDQVVSNWEDIKVSEKSSEQRRIDQSYLAFPSLLSAYKIGKKTKKLKFDWDNPIQVLDKVEEELQELKDEFFVKEGKISPEKMHEEMGDLLFSMAQLARHLKINPEEALRDANRKFIRRFYKVEDLIALDDKILENMNQAEMDVYWDLVKKEEKTNGIKK